MSGVRVSLLEADLVLSATNTTDALRAATAAAVASHFFDSPRRMCFPAFSGWASLFGLLLLWAAWLLDHEKCECAATKFN
jgi:hypothetical protein